jgi:hypothetical protein
MANVFSCGRAGDERDEVVSGGDEQQPSDDEAEDDHCDQYVQEIVERSDEGVQTEPFRSVRRSLRSRRPGGVGGHQHRNADDL